MFTHPKKKINQNKVILTATIIQSQHCHSCQKRFMSTAVVSHEVAFFTKMSHKLLSATALGVCANIIPCGSVFFFVFFPDSDSGWKALSAWMPAGPRPGFTEQAAALEHPACVLSIFKVTWVHFTATESLLQKTTGMCNRITLSVKTSIPDLKHKVPYLTTICNFQYFKNTALEFTGYILHH